MEDFKFDTTELEKKLHNIQDLLISINQQIEKLEKLGVTVKIEKINIHIDSH